MKRYLHLIVVLLFCTFSNVCESAIIYDHFDDGVLDPAWNVSFDNVTGWTYTEADSKLTVTNITMDPAIEDLVSGAVTLSQNVNNLQDFSIEAAISWDAGGLDTRIEVVCIFAMSGGQRIAYEAYDDSWYYYRAEKDAAIGYDDYYSSGKGTLPYSGEAVFNIERNEGLIEFYWDGQLIHSGTDYSLIDEVALQFRRHSYPGSSVGTLAFDYVIVTPEPGTLLLLGLGTLALRKRR